VRLEMKGTTTSDGKIKCTLWLTRAPKDWQQNQSREAQLSQDGNTIAGTATWDNAKHAFTWTRIRGVETVNAALEQQNAALGQQIDALTARLQETQKALTPAQRNQQEVIAAAINEHRLMNGMTVEQAGRAVSLTFRKLTTSSDGDDYCAIKVEGHMAIGEGYGTEYDLLVRNGEVVSWSSKPVEADSGQAGVSQ
jgi:hypothetical protein